MSSMKFSLKNRARTEPVRPLKRVQDVAQLEGPIVTPENQGAPATPRLGAPPPQGGPMPDPRVEPRQSQFARPPPPPPATNSVSSPDETNFEIPEPQMPNTGERVLEGAQGVARAHEVAQTQLGLRRKGYISGTPYLRDAPPNVKHESFYELLPAAQVQVTQYTQLLIWCLTRRIDFLQSQDGTYANHVMQEALRALIMKLATDEIPMNWTRAVVHRQQQGNEESRFAPNPRNKANQDQINNLNTMNESFDAERVMWMEVLREVETRPEPAKLTNFEPIAVPRLDIDSGATRVSEAVTLIEQRLAHAEHQLGTASRQVQQQGTLGILDL